MKKLLIGMILVLSGVNTVNGYVGHTHTIEDKTTRVIKARLDYHGASLVACRPDKNIAIDPNTARSVKSYGCQLKRIEIIDVIDGKEVKTVVNVKNASATVAKKVGAGVVAVGLAASTVNSNSFATTYIAGQEINNLARRDYTTAELVAYGSTRWAYYGPNQLEPVKGVDVYGKK